jgi:hypothetical protein
MYGIEVSDNAQLFGAHNAVNGGSAIDNRSAGQMHVSISGGEVNGGNGGEYGGDGIYGRVDPIHLDMSAGVIRGGTGGLEGGHGINSDNYLRATISGGEIIGGNSGISGGNGIDSTNDTNLLISGGAFQGGDGGEDGGSALRLVYGDYGDSTATISGGSFDAGVGLFEDGWLLELFGSNVNVDISGGLFGYESVGNGFGIFDGANVNVYGWDLNIVDGLLTGYLMDANWITTPVTLAYGSNPGTINLFNTHAPGPGASVPEPSTLMLLAAGLVGLGVVKRKRAT